MSLDFSSFGIDRLSISERLELVDFILAGLPEQVDPCEISDELRAELDRRCTAADANPQAGKPWREVLERIRAGL